MFKFPDSGRQRNLWEELCRQGLDIRTFATRIVQEMFTMLFSSTWLKSVMAMQS